MCLDIDAEFNMKDVIGSGSGRDFRNWSATRRRNHIGKSGIVVRLPTWDLSDSRNSNLRRGEVRSEGMQIAHLTWLCCSAEYRF